MSDASEIPKERQLYASVMTYYIRTDIFCHQFFLRRPKKKKASVAYNAMNAILYVIVCKIVKELEREIFISRLYPAQDGYTQT